MVYVIGAGIAGLTTSLFLIEKGYEVEILEKNEGIKSSACAEGCNFYSLEILPFNFKPFISKKVDGIKLFFGEKYFYIKIEGAVLEREKLMEKMAEEIVEKGGKIKFCEEVVNVDDEFIYTRKRKIKYDVCIGADGPLSVVKNYFGNKYEYKVGCQYKIKFDASDMNFLEIYFDKNFSNYYSWIFPKENTINVGLIGKFQKLDKFLKEKEIEGNILKKQAGLIPCSFPQKIADEKIALVGDSASITNPFSLGGISPAIHAGKILSENVENLKEYERKVMHEICNPVLIKGRKAVENLRKEEMEILFKKISGKEIGEIKIKDFLHLILHLCLFRKACYISKSLIHSLKWGW